MTENKDINKGGVGVLFYDGTCGICQKWALRIDQWFKSKGLEVVPFDNGAVEDEMRLRLNDGKEYGGADAAWILSGRLWWSWPFWLMGWLPGILPVSRIVYRRIAANRHCRNGQCKIGDLNSEPSRAVSKRWASWLIAFVIVGCGWWVGKNQEPWVMMWILASSQFMAFKFLVFSQMRGGSLGRWLAFLFLWPGMDARSFVNGCDVKRAGSWIEGGVFFLVGCILLGVLSGRVENPVLSGWLGMIGIIALLHFGVFTLLAKFWQSRGYGARPIMEAPWRANHLADFWGRSWNRAFSDVTRTMVFRPLSRRWGAKIALIGGFVFSGLAHEMVITVPAGAGYGLPTLYFLIQAAGVMLERRFKLGGITAKLFVWLVVLGPACFLFSRPFMERVIAPFLKVLGNIFVLGN